MKRLLKPRPKGYRPPPRPKRLPPADPTSVQVIRAAIKRRLADGPLGRVARMAVQRHLYIVGSNGPHCSIHPTATMGDTIVNATSGVITIEEYALFGHGVQLLAGTHDVRQTGLDRQNAMPDHGHDIIVKRGAWVASNVTVIGPAVIGENAVVSAGSVVTKDVPANTLVGGVPARPIKTLEFDDPGR